MGRRQAELEARYPAFKEASERLYEFQNRFKEVWGVETGLISEDMSRAWDEKWKYYVPFNRVTGEHRLKEAIKEYKQRREKEGAGERKGFANEKAPVKRAIGSSLYIYHPVDNIINNICAWVTAGINNNVMANLRNTAVDMKADALFMEQVPVPMVKKEVDITSLKNELIKKLEDLDIYDDGVDEAIDIIEKIKDSFGYFTEGKAKGSVVTVMIKGEPEFWKINDRLLLQSIAALSPKQSKSVLDAYAHTTRFMTMMTTVANPIWSIFSNAPRDLQTLFTYSEDKNPAHLIKAVASAYINSYNSMRGRDDKVDPLYREYIAMGGGKISAYTADRNLADKARKNLRRKPVSLRDPSSFIGHNPLDIIGFVTDTIEGGPRFAIYKVLRLNSMRPYEAFYEAMDITVNFRRSGDYSKQLNKIVPFFNANVQGLDKFVRWITAEDAKGGSRLNTVKSRAMSYFAGGIILGAIGYAINNRNAEARKHYQQLSNYTKNNFFCYYIGDGKFFTIPKAPTVTIPTSFIESWLEYNVGGNKHAFDEFGQYVIDTTLPPAASDLAALPLNGLENTAAAAVGSMGMLGTLYYATANRDFRGRPIISEAMQALEKKDQYNNRTSKAAYWVGQALNQSPMMIDFLAESLAGAVQDTSRALFPVGGENIDYTLGVRNTYAKDSLYSTDLVNWLYDKADSSSRAKNSDKSNMSKAITAKMDSNMTSFYSNYNKLSKNEEETKEARSARQTVLDMIMGQRENSAEIETPATNKMKDTTGNKVGKVTTIYNLYDGNIPVEKSDAHIQGLI